MAPIPQRGTDVPWITHKRTYTRDTGPDVSDIRRLVTSDPKIIGRHYVIDIRRRRSSERLWQKLTRRERAKPLLSRIIDVMMCVYVSRAIGRFRCRYNNDCTDDMVTYTSRGSIFLFVRCLTYSNVRRKTSLTMSYSIDITCLITQCSLLCFDFALITII